MLKEEEEEDYILNNFRIRDCDGRTDRQRSENIWVSWDERNPLQDFFNSSIDVNPKK